MYNPSNFYNPPSDQIYHLVYLTTNLTNNKIYIGVHSTYNIDDGYLGSGDKLKLAIQKYGRLNFKREILYFCVNKYESLSIEATIVNASFIRRNDVYNITIGGSGVELECMTNEDKAIIKKLRSDGCKRRNIKHGNPFTTKENIERTRLKRIGKTYEEIYGEEKGNAMRKRCKSFHNTPEALAKRKITIDNRSEEEKLQYSINLSNSLKGKQKSAEHKKNLSLSKKGKPSNNKNKKNMIKDGKIIMVEFHKINEYMKIGYIPMGYTLCEIVLGICLIFFKKS